VWASGFGKGALAARAANGGGEPYRSPVDADPGQDRRLESVVFGQVSSRAGGVGESARAVDPATKGSGPDPRSAAIPGGTDLVRRRPHDRRAGRRSVREASRGPAVCAGSGREPVPSA